MLLLLLLLLQPPIILFPPPAVGCWRWCCFHVSDGFLAFGERDEWAWEHQSDMSMWRFCERGNGCTLACGKRRERIRLLNSGFDSVVMRGRTFATSHTLLPLPTRIVFCDGPGAFPFIYVFCVGG
ncbi:hypothetical protein AAC387_Pa11g1242 [Persea americana]